ncbi:MAG: N-acetylmuramoyl-L-alanine amidase [Terrimonas sp.]|nr:N-acetylmuramoyl-L-alanine amidase [Terrimonas sp.]
MKRNAFLFFLVVFAVGFLAFVPASFFQKSVNTIIIDPGHGGIDPGAKGSYSTEAQICLEISLKLGKMLQKEIPDLKVLYTRTTNVMAGNKPTKNEGLRYRADFANQSGADLFIAIHCNSAPSIRHRTPNGYRWVKRKGKKVKQTIYKTYYTPNPAHGTETFVWAVDRNDAKGEVIRTEDMYGESDSTIVAPDENDPVIKALRLLYTRKFFKNSVTLADFVEKEFIAGGRFSRGVKQRNEAGIWVLQATGMPSILVETGFISDKDEENYLNSDKGQEEICISITNAVKNYIDWLEKLKNGNTQNNDSKKPVSRDPVKTAAVLNRNTVKTSNK